MTGASQRDSVDSRTRISSIVKGSLATDMLKGACAFGTAFLLTFIPGYAGNTVMAQMSTEMTLTDSGIAPSTMTATKGQPFSIHVTNRGSKVHNLVIPRFFIFTSNLQPGEDTNVKFTPDKTGTFPYYSDAGGKPEPGLRGSLTVR